MKRVLLENEVIKFISESNAIDTDTKIEYINRVYNLSEDDLSYMYEQLGKAISVTAKKASHVAKLKAKAIPHGSTKTSVGIAANSRSIVANNIKKNMNTEIKNLKLLYKQGTITKDQYIRRLQYIKNSRDAQIAMTNKITQNKIKDLKNR